MSLCLTLSNIDDVAGTAKARSGQRNNGSGISGDACLFIPFFFNRVTKWLSHAAQFLEAMVG